MTSVSTEEAVTLAGYVGDEELRELDRQSQALFCLSDFEAFGLPILEALASGTPVFLSRLRELESLFSDCRAAHFCPHEDPNTTAKQVLSTLARHEGAIREAVDDIPRLQAIFDWDRIALRKWRFLASAWSRKHLWSWSG